MYIHMYLYICIYIYIYIYEYMHLYIYICICICIHVYIHIWVHIYIYTYMMNIYKHIHMYTLCVHIYLYIYIYICIYVCIYVLAQTAKQIRGFTKKPAISNGSWPSEKRDTSTQTGSQSSPTWISFATARSTSPTFTPKTHAGPPCFTVTTMTFEPLERTPIPTRPALVPAHWALLSILNANVGLCRWVWGSWRGGKKSGAILPLRSLKARLPRAGQGNSRLAVGCIIELSLCKTTRPAFSENKKCRFSRFARERKKVIKMRKNAARWGVIYG